MWKLALLLAFGMTLIPTGDAAGKLLQTYGIAAGFVVWARFTVGSLVVLPFLPRSEYVHFANWRLWFRGALLTGGILSIVTALSHVPMADAFAGLFVGPLVSVILSALFLREKVSGVRWLLVILGFVGVLLVIRPSGDISFYQLVSVLAGVFYGAFLTTSRWMSNVIAPTTLLASQMATAALLTLPFAFLHWPELSWPIIGLLLVSGLCSMGGNLTLLIAYSRATVAQVAPFVYFQLLAATALGYFIFRDIPVTLTWVGMVLIAGAGVVSARLPAARSTNRA